MPYYAANPSCLYSTVQHVSYMMYAGLSKTVCLHAMLCAGKLPMQNVTSVQWLPPRSGSECLLVAGVADGSLYVYKVGVKPLCCLLQPRDSCT
jgi:hypothetical protein